ncbi:MAG: hypothetical protein HY432_03340 [Candidatus Liptonbacteria bacterium]|nr:hypothetical protein [Candidatus Liptonbacteria bacterium]
MNFSFSRKGQSALSFVILVGLITLSMGVTIALLSSGFINSGYGFQAANHAIALAYAGAEDALMKLARNKDFSSPSAYSVPVGSESASVTVTQNSPTSGKATIVSTASYSFWQRKVQTIVSVNSTTSEINVISWQFLTF